MVSKIDTVLIKLEAMEKSKTRQQEDLQKMLQPEVTHPVKPVLENHDHILHAPLFQSSVPEVHPDSHSDRQETKQEHRPVSGIQTAASTQRPVSGRFSAKVPKQ